MVINKMAPNSLRIGYSKEQYGSREEAKQAGMDYLEALEERYQAGRSFRVVSIKSTEKFEYHIYLGDKPSFIKSKGV